MSDDRPVIVEGSFPWQAAQQLSSVIDIETAKQAAMAAVNPNMRQSIQYTADNSQIAPRENKDMDRGANGRGGFTTP